MQSLIINAWISDNLVLIVGLDRLQLAGAVRIRSLADNDRHFTRRPLPLYGRALVDTNHRRLKALATKHRLDVSLWINGYSHWHAAQAAAVSTNNATVMFDSAMVISTRTQVLIFVTQTRTN